MNAVQYTLNDVHSASERWSATPDLRPPRATGPHGPRDEGGQMATMTRWDPFQDLRSAQEEMAQMAQMGQMSPMLAHALGLHAKQQGSGTATAWAPALDISERKDAYLVTVELPGVEADDLEITLEDGLLTIQGERQFTSESSEQQFHRVERRYGAFRRSITLPAQVQTDQIEASFDNGVLQIVVPKAEEATPKRIQVRPGRAEILAASSEDTTPSGVKAGRRRALRAGGGVRGPAPPPPPLPPPALSAGFNSDYNPSARRSSVTPPTPTRRPPQRGSLM